MLKIRTAQFEAFEQAFLKQFEDEMVRGLREFSPEHARGVGEEGLRKVIRRGIERAKRYGFALRGSVRFYIELMIQYGCDFDTDPVLPWATQELQKPSEEAELDRADRLHATAMDYRRAVIGNQYEVEIAAIRRLLAKPGGYWLHDGLSPRELEVRLQEVHPAKCERAGQAGLLAVIAKGREAARQERLAEDTGGTVMTALMFAFGHGVRTDPQDQWVAAVLAETAGQPARIRTEKLGMRMLAYLSAGLKLLEGK
jgi:hypothetical protein